MAAGDKNKGKHDELDGRNRRRDPRIDARIRVAFKSGPEFIACYTENISKGGMYLQTEVAPDPNAMIELVMNLPKGGDAKSPEQITLQGRVVRLMSISEGGKASHKVAIQFLELTPQLQMQLDLLYEDLSKNISKK